MCPHGTGISTSWNSGLLSLTPLPVTESEVMIPVAILSGKCELNNIVQLTVVTVYARRHCVTVSHDRQRNWKRRATLIDDTSGLRTAWQPTGSKLGATLNPTFVLIARYIFAKAACSGNIPRRNYWHSKWSANLWFAWRASGKGFDSYCTLNGFEFVDAKIREVIMKPAKSGQNFILLVRRLYMIISFLLHNTKQLSS